jgi:SpoVK/Ycf46/Vps4 family AAA+-type ATPase
VDDSRDLELILRSRIPVVVIETHEEPRAVDLLKRLAAPMKTPVYRWAATEGLRRVDTDMPPQRHNIEPGAVLAHIRSARSPGLYVLLDFHPYLGDPMHVRLLKDIALECDGWGATIVLISHALTLPDDLARYSARFELALPDTRALRGIVNEVAREWADANGGRRVRADPEAVDALIRNLAGLPLLDARRLVRNAVYHDGAITREDLPALMQAKYRLLDGGGVLTFEYETERFADVGGMRSLKTWLDRRRVAFRGDATLPGLDPPRGILLLGVQGCGKSLASRAVAGVFGVPLLRLDFGTLYNKYYGETERNLREALRTAEVMAPCVLWMDELEKGVAADSGDGGGPSRRVLGTLLTWMAEHRSKVFMVATANDIQALPPELVRKGRFDEIFFVDLPDDAAREMIFAVHLRRREIDPDGFDLPRLAAGSEGFSGAEIEQAVVSALYEAHARGSALDTDLVVEELARTRPLSVVMGERIAALRAWAAERTVPAD